MTIGQVDGYQVSDLLLDYASSSTEIGPVPAQVRRLLAEHADPAVCWRLSIDAFQAEELDIAEIAARRSIQTKDPHSFLALGLVLFRKGEDAEAEQWLRQAAEADGVDGPNREF